MKKYFKLVSVVFVLSLFTNNLFAQGIYAKINFGYGIKTSSQNINYFNITNHTIDTVSSSFEQVATSLGKGFSCEGALGYMFNKNIGAEIGISYLLGARTKTTQELYGNVHNNCISANMLRINPTVIIANGFDKINPYAKLGLIIGFGKIIYEDDYSSVGGTVVSEKMELSEGAALGFNAGVGIIYNINTMISLYGEINMVNLSYAPTKGILTESTLNGIDHLPDMTTNEKEVDFVDSYTTNLNYPYTHTEPRKELKESYPFGSVGLNVGIIIIL